MGSAVTCPQLSAWLDTIRAKAKCLCVCVFCNVGKLTLSLTLLPTQSTVVTLVIHRL